MSAGKLSASKLRIRVMEGARTKVDLSMGAGVAAHLADFVPDGIGDKLRAKGIDVGKIAEEASAGDISPRELFSYEDGPKTVRIWLE